jgi:hypothetical protein
MRVCLLMGEIGCGDDGTGQVVREAFISSELYRRSICLPAHEKERLIL